ncbi:MAG: Gfo/Idh/MocA family protein [Solirubrobacteraceae bacterium]
MPLVTRWGLLSTARINDALLAGMALVAETRPVAVASRDAQRARAYARARDIETAYGSYEELLADPTVDIVYISLPNSMHVEWTRRAMNAGKHVLCEKPLSRSPVEVAALFDLADSRGLVLSEAFMYRHHPQTAALKALVDSGELGELRLLRATFSFSCDPGDPRLRAELDGGGMMDVGCYPVSMFRLLAGEPVRASVEQLTGGDGVDVVAAAVMRFSGGVIGHFDSGLAMPDRSGLEIVGARATVTVAHPWQPRPGTFEIWHDGVQQPQRVLVPDANSYAIQVADLSAAVRGERPQLLGRVDAVGQAAALAALYSSAASGGTVTL